MTPVSTSLFALVHPYAGFMLPSFEESDPGKCAGITTRYQEILFRIPVILAAKSDAEDSVDRKVRRRAREDRLVHLVDLCVAGQNDSFDELAELIRDQIYVIAWKYSGNREDSLDITQNVLLRVFRALPRWRGQCRFTTWVHRITMNASVDFFRRHSKHENQRVDPEEVKRYEEGRGSSDPFLGIAAETPRHAAQRSEVITRIYEALPELSEKQRECFIYRHFHGMSLEEVAEAAGCSQGSVKRHLFRASRKLRELLADLQPMLESGTLSAAEEG